MIEPILYHAPEDRKGSLKAPPLTVSRPALHPWDVAVLKVLEWGSLVVLGVVGLLILSHLGII